MKVCISINNVSYSKWQTTSIQILSPILRSNITENGIRFDLQYLHHLHIGNIRHIKDLSCKDLVSISSNFTILLMEFSIVLTGYIYFKCKNRRGTLRLPPEISFQEIELNYL